MSILWRTLVTLVLLHESFSRKFSPGPSVDPGLYIFVLLHKYRPSTKFTHDKNAINFEKKHSSAYSEAADMCNTAMEREFCQLSGKCFFKVHSIFAMRKLRTGTVNHSKNNSVFFKR